MKILLYQPLITSIVPRGFLLNKSPIRQTSMSLTAQRQATIYFFRIIGWTQQTIKRCSSRLIKYEKGVVQTEICLTGFYRVY